MSESSLSRLIDKAGKANERRGISWPVSPTHVTFSPQTSKRNRSVGPEPTALQLRRSISNTVEHNVIEEINLHQASREGMIDVVEALLSDGSHDLNEIDALGFSPLHYAARHNRVDVTQRLLDCGADPNLFNLYDTRRLTPLQLACWFNSLETVRVLVNAGSGVCKEKPFGQRAIHCAAARGGPKIIEELLLVGKVDPNSIDNIGFTPLHIAANRGREEIVKVLLIHGADLTIQDNDGNMPAHIAAREGHVTTLKTLLQSAYMKSISIEYVLGSTGTGSCLQLAVKKSNVEAAKVCIEFGASTSANLHDTSPPLHTACIKGNIELVKTLVSRGASLEAEDIEGMTPILRACLTGNVDIIDYLINQGVSLEAEVDAPSPLMCAVKRGHCHAIRLLLRRRGSSICVRDSYHRTCLHVAVCSDNEESLDILLEHSAKFLINSRDKDDNTPLHFAAINGNLKMILKLLSSGADVNLSDDEDKLPIHHAGEVGDLECFKALFDVNPESIHATDYRLRTPLYYAALENRTQIVRFLIEKGAHVNIRDDDRITPLLAVSSEGSAETVQLLLEYGAKIESLSKNRTTSLNVAAFHGNTPVVKLLLDAGAKLDNQSPFGNGCLDNAIRVGKKDTCMEIVRHKRWRDALEVKGLEGYTCMKGLIEKFPDVAKVVLDKCMVFSNHLSTDENYSMTYNFDFLSIPPDERIYKGCNIYFGPQIMLQNGRKELLLHPVTRELLSTKWNAIARYQVLFSLVMFVAFVVNFTLFMVCFGEINLKTGEMISTDDSLLCRHDVMYLQSLAVSVFSGVWILVHIYRIFREKWNYMNRDSFVEVGMLLSCLMSSLVGSLLHDKTFQFKWGIYSLLLCYIVLLFYIQTIFDSGIYVTMLFVVLKSLLKVMAIFLVLLLAFALIFHILLYSGENLQKIKGPGNSTIAITHPFQDIMSSAVKVIAMMIGELEYTRFFVEQQNDIPYLAILVFVIFCVFLPIVLMNLLIGLAVGDIESVQKNAELKLLAIKIEVIYALEQQLPAAILRYFYKPFIVKYPNKSLGWCFKVLKAVGHRLVGNSSDHDDLSDNPDRGDMESVEGLATRLCGKIEEQDKRMDQLVSDVEKQRTILDQIAEVIFKENDSYL